ncbi:hypothetical protein WJX77_011591 [Trebouxia sp. C0004]
MVRIETVDIPGSGRGLVSATPIAAGELVLRESPVTLTVTQTLHRAVCAYCLRYIAEGAAVECTGCKQASFCNERCQQRACRQAHTATICHSTAKAGLDNLDPETADQARFIIQAQDLIDPEHQGGALWRKKALALLQSADEDHADTAEVLKWAEKYFGAEKWQKWKVAARKLASQDRINSYGIMAPLGPHGERRIRGSGVYPMSSLLNHDCMPNVARYDYFDGPQEDNSIVEFRALHDIPADTQITQSYFPLSWSFEDRQQRCKAQYGFTCSCDRCQVEQHWQGASDDEASDAAGFSVASDHVEGRGQRQTGAAEQKVRHDGEAESEPARALQQGAEGSLRQERDQCSKEGRSQEREGQHGKSDGGVNRDLDEQQGMNEGSHADSAEDSAEDHEVPDEAYIMAYLGRHVCPQELPAANEEEGVCGGTMTPVGVHGDAYACNMCGFERLESERLAELEKMYQAVAQEVQ